MRIYTGNFAYDRKKIYEQAKQVIKDENLFFIQDIIAFLPISIQTFYKFYPVGSNELNTLKDLLRQI